MCPVCARKEAGLPSKLVRGVDNSIVVYLLVTVSKSTFSTNDFVELEYSYIETEAEYLQHDKLVIFS